MVGLEVQVAVGVRGLPVHRGVNAAIILPPEQDVQEREGSILLDLYCELDGWTKAVKVAQELLHSTFPQNHSMPAPVLYSHKLKVRVTVAPSAINMTSH